MSHASGSPRVFSIQALRGLAAAFVVWGHAEMLVESAAPQNVSPLRHLSELGAFGVDVFFVISGVVMVITSSKLFGDPRARGQFLAARLTRIYPPYWVYATAMLALVGLSRDGVDAWYVLESYALVPVLNAKGKLRPILGVGWTLTYELYFYLLFALCLGMKRHRAVLALFALLSIICAGARGFLTPNTALGAFLQDYIVVEFAVGAALGTQLAKLRTLPRWLGPVALLLAVALLAVTGPNVAASERWFRWGFPALLIVVGALTVDQQGLVRIPRSLVTLGDASYSLYLLHPVMFSVLRVVDKRVGFMDRTPAGVTVLAITTLAVLLSIPAHKLVELPLIAFARNIVNGVLRRSPRSPAAPPLGGMDPSARLNPPP